MTNSVHFRKKVLKLQSLGESFIKLSKRFKTSTPTISRWKKEIEDYLHSYSYERPRRLASGFSAPGTLNHPKADYATRSMFCQRIDELKKINQ